MRASVVAMTTMTEICIPLNKIYFPITTVIFVVVVVFFIVVVVFFSQSFIRSVSAGLISFVLYSGLIFLFSLSESESFVRSGLLLPLIYLGC